MSHKVWIDPPAIAETKATPGNVRRNCWVTATADRITWLVFVPVQCRDALCQGKLEAFLHGALSFGDQLPAQHAGLLE